MNNHEKDLLILWIRAIYEQCPAPLCTLYGKLLVKTPYRDIASLVLSISGQTHHKIGTILYAVVWLKQNEKHELLLLQRAMRDFFREFQLYNPELCDELGFNGWFTAAYDWLHSGDKSMLPF